ncbi:response regulator transcription factor [Mucilaginibacter ginsenosidivorax]|uniref:Response regulator transcription factor n=1 Tax=Mucilaginibacter ginsenosidivorax TaxID=862126 RepID=A0A5B8W3L0_9SPHI|nr:response regulator transcription factor [Mucilaginibacter ginsenosidivorax]QEC77565.1 response regulator transcription factor [Mucilaginibacter ginsenosidivorax]
MEQIRVAIVDDQNIFRQSLAILINSVPNFELVADAGSAAALLEILKTIPSLPQVLLLDMNMPGMNGIELNQLLQQQYPQIKVMVLSVHSQERLIAKMVSAGASAYLFKNCDKEELITAIQTVHHTGFYINRQTLAAIQNAAARRGKSTNVFSTSPFELTNREKEVLELICKEYASSEIAQKLFLSIRTVEGHRNNLLLKTQSRNTAGLVLYAVKHQLIEVI